MICILKVYTEVLTQKVQHRTQSIKVIGRLDFCILHLSPAMQSLLLCSHHHKAFQINNCVEITFINQKGLMVEIKILCTTLFALKSEGSSCIQNQVMYDKDILLLLSSHIHFLSNIPLLPPEGFATRQCLLFVQRLYLPKSPEIHAQKSHREWTGST